MKNISLYIPKLEDYWYEEKGFAYCLVTLFAIVYKER